MFFCIVGVIITILCGLQTYHVAVRVGSSSFPHKLSGVLMAPSRLIQLLTGFVVRLSASWPPGLS